MIQSDTDVTQVVVSHVAIERKSVIPIHAQLRNAIEQAIFSGEIPDGTPLPSVRRLADALEVAPNTVVRAYRDLEGGGWVRADPKRGYFVTLGSEVSRNQETDDFPDVSRLIDQALITAKASGMNTRTFLDLVRERVRHHNVTPRYVAIVGYPEAFLEQRVRLVQNAINDTDYGVIGISIRDLENWNDEEFRRLDNVEYVLVPVGEVRDASKLLGRFAQRILPMTRTLHPDVRASIAKQPADTRFGVIAGAMRHSGRITAALRRYHPLEVPPAVASIEHPGEVEQVIENSDVIVIGTRARPYFMHRGLPSKPCIEMLYVPDQKTLDNLRSLLRPLSTSEAASTPVS